MLASDSPTRFRVLKHDASSMAPSPPIRKPVWHHHHSCGDTCTLQRALSPPHVHVDPDVLVFLLDFLRLPIGAGVLEDEAQTPSTCRTETLARVECLIEVNLVFPTRVRVFPSPSVAANRPPWTPAPSGTISSKPKHQAR